MRITCPICGERDRREFYYRGAALDRPDPETGQEAWGDYVYLRDNPAGRTRDLWYHEAGCGSWLVVERDTVSHSVLDVALALDADA